MTLNYQELAARERVIAERETLMAERDGLEAEKIRSSHSAARDVVRLSQQINMLEDSIQLRQEGGGVKGRGKGGSAGDKEQEIAKLIKERSEELAHTYPCTSVQITIFNVPENFAKPCIINIQWNKS